MIRTAAPASRLFKGFAQAAAPLIDLIFPPRCPACGSAIAEQSGLCSACWSELVIPGEPACLTCQRPFGESGPKDGAICAVCLHNPPSHDGIAAATLYNSASRKLVLAYKHGGRIALAPMLARQIAARLPPLEGEWIIMPVPLHRWRLWRRGFNQAALLAKQIGALRNLPVLLEGLQRHRQTPSLGGLGRNERLRAVKGVVRVLPRQASRIKGAQIILVDDVLTSGATSNACVGALKQAGADKVIIACFARVLDQPLV